MSQYHVTRTISSNPHFIKLVEELDTYLAIIDGDEHDFYDQFNSIDALNHVVLIFDNDMVVGCGAFKELDSETVEIKRMFTREVARRKGIASMVLKELENWILELKYRKVRLETGVKMANAVGLYKKLGYQSIENYGQYKGKKLSVCFEKDLVKNNLELIPFERKHFDLFKSWITNEEDMVQFAGTIFRFPLTNDQLEAYLNEEKLQPFQVVLKGTDSVIGHCELNYQNDIPRLSRVLIADPRYRGVGLGEDLIRLMAQTLFKDTSVNVVDLNVFAFNKAAISCYKKVGFVINPDKSVNVPVGQKQWLCLNMTLNRFT